MLKILIVEDNPVYVALLKNKLANISVPFINVGVASNIKAALNIIQQQSPNVLILDVDLKTESSFELFDHINFKDYQIIFATAHEDYAISAFDVEAVGYLLKPVIASQLEKFLLVAQNNLLGKNIHTLAEKNNIPKHAITDTTISVPSETGFDIVPINTITRCESVNNITHIFLSNNKKLVSSYNLGKFWDMLCEKGFTHVHRSHIINLNFVKKYLRSGIIIMHDDIEIPLSKNNRNEFIAIFSVKDK